MIYGIDDRFPNRLEWIGHHPFDFRSTRYLLEDGDAERLQVAQGLSDLMMERSPNRPLLDEVSARVIGKLHQVDLRSGKHVVRIIGEEQEGDVPRRLVGIQRRRELHPRIDTAAERNGSADLAANIGQESLHQSFRYVVNSQDSVDAVIEWNLRRLLEQLRPQRSSRRYGLRAFPDIVGSVAARRGLRSFVGSVVAARSPDHQHGAVFICCREKNRVIGWIDPVALTENLSLYSVQVGLFQAARRKNRIASVVGLDTQNHVSAIQVQQIVCEGADRADHRRLRRRVPDRLELPPIVLYGPGMDQVVETDRKTAFHRYGFVPPETMLPYIASAHYPAACGSQPLPPPALGH